MGEAVAAVVAEVADEEEEVEEEGAVRAAEEGGVGEAAVVDAVGDEEVAVEEEEVELRRVLRTTRLETRRGSHNPTMTQA